MIRALALPGAGLARGGMQSSGRGCGQGMAVITLLPLSHGILAEGYVATESDGRKVPPPGNKLGATSRNRHEARLRKAKPEKIPKPTHGAQNRPKPLQSRAGQDRASGSGQRLASRLRL
jgi:hypothetical protein